MAKEKLNPEEQAILVQAYVERKRSCRCIAKEFNVTDMTVIRYLGLHNVQMRPAGGRLQTTPDLVDLAIQMREQKLPWKTVSKKIGITTSTLLRHIKKRKELQ